MKYDECQFYIYPGYDHVFQYLLKELETNSNCHVIKHIHDNMMVIKLWEKMLNHPKLHFCFNSFLSYLTSFSLINPSKSDQNNIFVFSNISIQYVSNHYLKKLKKRGKIVLYFLDDLSNPNSVIAFKKTKQFQFDVICTFDKKNAEENGFLYCNSMYSKLSRKQFDIKYDLLFIGSDKGRAEIIDGVYTYIKNKYPKIKPFFSVYQVADWFMKKYQNEMKINESMDYSETVDMVKKCNCILDIVIGEQRGLSLRAYEAIVYNKKLITNNPAILEFPYYNDKYMKLFVEPKDIDIGFIMEHIDVDYQYKDEYSPYQFLKKICKAID